MTERSDSRISEDLRGVDALCERWAREAWDWTKRETSPLYRAMREREGAAAPGGPPVMSHEVAVLDSILASSEPRYLALVKTWYVSRDPVMVKARKLSVNRRKIYDLWRRTLEYLRGRLHAEGVNV